MRVVSCTSKLASLRGVPRGTSISVDRPEKTMKLVIVPREISRRLHARQPLVGLVLEESAGRGWLLPACRIDAARPLSHPAGRGAESEAVRVDATACRARGLKCRGSPGH